MISQSLDISWNWNSICQIGIMNNYMIDNIWNLDGVGVHQISITKHYCYFGHTNLVKNINMYLHISNCLTFCENLRTKPNCLFLTIFLFSHWHEKTFYKILVFCNTRMVNWNTMIRFNSIPLSRILWKSLKPIVVRISVSMATIVSMFALPTPFFKYDFEYVKTQ